MAELEKIYRRRFGNETDFRKGMYNILCKDFFQQYVPKESVVLDVAAGYCEFINNIEAKEKIALDKNTDVKKFASKEIKIIITDSTNMNSIKDESIDIAFTSNFFEHISRDDILKTLQEIHRVLKKNGKLLILQPNIRYCYRDYWMFFDHITPIDDRSLCEALELNGFEILENIPRFLPYTTKGNLPKSLLLLKIYLKLRFLHRIFGKQAFICVKKM
ncbi:MAG: methyltransferase domain-containing protein [Nanoarchaeota archaeon]